MKPQDMRKLMESIEQVQEGYGWHDVEHDTLWDIVPSIGYDMEDTLIYDEGGWPDGNMVGTIKVNKEGSAIGIETGDPKLIQAIKKYNKPRGRR